MLTQEPWCFHPEQIATLTDWQIEHLYAKPAIERAKQIESQRKGKPAMRRDENAATATVQPLEPGSPEFRGWVIAQFMTMGMNRADAEKQYEEQARNMK
jgi:hypothetical protein